MWDGTGIILFISHGTGNEMGREFAFISCAVAGDSKSDADRTEERSYAVLGTHQGMHLLLLQYPSLP